MVKLICQICGKEYWKQTWQVAKSKYCSLECLTESKRKPKLKKICQHCGVHYEVQPHRQDAKYCSAACNNASKCKPKTIARCLACGTILELQPYAVGTRKYCSQGCYVKHHVPWNKGIAFEALSGPNHPNWQGGITSENTRLRRSLEYKQWRQGVFRRDWFKCVICNQKARDIEAHHIRPVRDETDSMLDVGNGVTLCVACHLAIRNKENDFADMFEKLLEDQQKFRHAGWEDSNGQMLLTGISA